MIFELLFRWLHLLTAILLVGGIFSQRFALIPALAVLDEKQREELKSAYRAHWSKIVMLASSLLLLSGIVNSIRILLGYEFASDTYVLLLATKMMISLGIFWISAMLAGRSLSARQIQQNSKLWLNLNVALAIAVVCIAGFMKVTPRASKSKPPSTDAVKHWNTVPKGVTHG